MAEKWVLLRDLGAGGFGKVVLCEEEHSQRQLAVKILTRKDSRKALERWHDECKELSELDHPNVVKSHQSPKMVCELLGDNPIFCMEYCELGSLRLTLHHVLVSF